MKNKISFIVDALMFLAMMAIAGIGFLMNWVLLPGREAAVTYGRLVDLVFLGLDRHQWGDVHLIVGLVLLALLVLHIVLHYRQVLHMFCKLISVRPVRLVVGVVFLVLAVALVAFPLLVRPQVQERGGGGKGGLVEGQGGGRGGGGRWNR